MPDEIRYVPLLKGKRGEYAALRELEDWRKPYIRPLIDVPLISAYGTQRSVDRHMELQLNYIQQHWGSASPVIVDLRMLDTNARMGDGSHPLVWLAREAHARGLSVIPSTGPHRPAEYRLAAREACAIAGMGAAMRLQGSSLAAPDLRSVISTECEHLQIPVSTVDLILDFHDIPPHAGGATALSAAGVLAGLGDWREPGLLVFAAGAFPTTLGGIPNRFGTRLPRAEWEAYELLLSRLTDARRPIFGDYGVTHPDLEDFDASRAGGSVPVAGRYTAPDAWLIWKEGRIRDVTNNGYHDVANWLVRQPEYSGDGYSWGDSFFKACADRRTSPGNAETWRKAGTSHHLALVIDAMLGIFPPSSPLVP